MLTHGSLFAGIGGFDLGFERAGIKTLWQVEIDPYCQRVLAKHFPSAVRHGDIRTCGKHNLASVDILSGGFPCQDISGAGGRAGINGERSGLWSEYFRIICELRPRIVVVENVSALLVRGMERVLGDLAKGGYDAEWDCLPAAAFGAPHLRDRVFILAYPTGKRRDDGIYPIGEQQSSIYEGNNGETVEWGEDRKCITLVQGIRIGTDADWWRTQSRVARSANGIPYVMDRLHGCGNAIVPQIAEWIGRRIVEVAT